MSEPAWWGSCEVEVGGGIRWQVGALAMWLLRLPGEWRVIQSPGVEGDAVAGASFERISADSVELSGGEEILRFGLAETSNRVSLTPMLADRPVITSPEIPFYIPAGQACTIYVGSPLWLGVAVGEPAISLAEFPILRPSDTWFGPNTYEGELCYAARSACRLRLAELPARPYRAITAVTVENRADERLLLARMKLPVTYLPLFIGEGGDFWTGDVTIEHAAGENLDPVIHSGKPPRHAGNAQLLGPPRQRSDGSVAMRVFSFFQ